MSTVVELPTDRLLVIDLDGTLVATDTLHESLIALLRRNPLHLFWLPLWLVRGKAYFKEQVAARSQIKAAALPYHQELIAIAQAHRLRGGRVALATAAHQRIANAVAGHLQIFDRVEATRGRTNLSGGRQAASDHLPERQLCLRR